jgi:hypothetical protein
MLADILAPKHNEHRLPPFERFDGSPIAADILLLFALPVSSSCCRFRPATMFVPKNSRELKRAAESVSGYGLVWPAALLLYLRIPPC